MVKKKSRKENHEQLIYKNSKNSFNTYSRTFSSASKLYSESVVLNLKKKLSHRKYYEYRGKLRRDLSIATDLCILRNYCKVNRDRLSIKTPKTTFSNYNSDMNSVIDFIENGCGDSIAEIKNNTQLNIDLTSLVMDNLKHLLNNWIRKHLLNKNETKEKIESVLDSILYRLASKANTTSCYSYEVDVKVVDRNNLIYVIDNEHNRTPIKYTTSTTSVFTIPLTASRSQVVSTVSMPKRWLDYRDNHRKKGNYKTRLSHSRGKIKVCRSYTNVVKVSTGTFIKHCTNCNKIENEISGGAKHWVNLPKANEQEKINYKGKKEYRKPHGHDASDAYNCVFGNNYNVTNLQKALNKQKTNNLSHVRSQQSVTGRHKQKRSRKREYKRSRSRNTPKKLHRIAKRKRNSTDKWKKVNLDTYSSINTKDLPLKKQKMYKHLKDILKCMSCIEDVSTIKLDISVNICPMHETLTNKNKESVEKNIAPAANKDFKGVQGGNTDTKIIKNLNDNVPPQTVNYTTYKSEYNPNIITFPDSTLNTENKIVNHSTITETCEKNNKKINNGESDAYNGAQMARDINELKLIVRKLANTAKKFLSEHLIASVDYYSESKDTNNENQNTHSDICVQMVPSNDKDCKCIQVTNGNSDSELRNSPRQSHRNDEQRLMQSYSYKFIENETATRVSDMMRRKGSVGETILESASSSRTSAIQTAIRNDRKLYAFYCDPVQHKEIGEMSRQYTPCRCLMKSNPEPKSIATNYSSKSLTYIATPHKNRNLDRDKNRNLDRDTELNAVSTPKRAALQDLLSRYEDLKTPSKLIVAILIIPLVIVFIVLVYYFIHLTFAFKKYGPRYQKDPDVEQAMSLEELGF